MQNNYTICSCTRTSHSLRCKRTKKSKLVLSVNSPFHSSWKVTTLFTWNRGEGWARTVREVKIIDMLISIFLMIIISTSLTLPTQPSPRFHVEAWLPYLSAFGGFSIFVYPILNNHKMCMHKRITTVCKKWGITYICICANISYPAIYMSTTKDQLHNILMKKTCISLTVMELYQSRLML